MRMIDTRMMQMERITRILIQFYNWLALLRFIKTSPQPSPKEREYDPDRGDVIKK